MKEPDHKIESVWTYLLIFFLLMALLVGTVAAATVNLGRWNIVIALVIAVVKALLVILFFMHVRHSSRQTWIFAGAAFLWLTLLLAGTIADYASRNAPVPTSDAAQPPAHAKMTNAVPAAS
jgi:cytochrome c oxidase subunit 4